LHETARVRGFQPARAPASFAAIEALLATVSACPRSVRAGTPRPARAATQLDSILAGQGIQGGWNVLETIAIILIVLWLLGMVSGYTLGNFIWVLLVVAIVLFLVRLVSGRRVV
jgi:hypothetical protein